MGGKKTENPLRITSKRVSSTQSRGRTGTGVTPLVFETSASTDSAIWAIFSFGKRSNVNWNGKDIFYFLNLQF